VKRSKESAAGTAFDKAREAALTDGVVVLERAGKALGLGTVMNGDGRIVTALSVLGDGRHVDVRYADGSLVPARIGHAMHVRDLALLVPQSGRKRPGLRASREATKADAPLRPFVRAGSKTVLAPALTPAGPTAVTGSDGKPLADAITFKAPPRATSAGSPLLDENGEVSAVTTRAFKRAPGAKPAPVLVGTPVSVVRDFLKSAPPTAALPSTGIGVQGEAADAGVTRGVRVTAVRGPALMAGLKAGKTVSSADVIVAVDGVPVITPDALSSAVADRAIGDPVDLIVLSGGRYRHVTVVVAQAPR
jgi:serine protease Do